jgi:hypothetical protein
VGGCVQKVAINASGWGRRPGGGVRELGPKYELFPTSTIIVVVVVGGGGGGRVVVVAVAGVGA